MGTPKQDLLTRRMAASGECSWMKAALLPRIQAVLDKHKVISFEY
jgi:hypothetical protein